MDTRHEQEPPPDQHVPGLALIQPRGWPHELSNGRPSRSGQPWTDEDYEQIIVLVREGHELEVIAEALGRTTQAVTPRLRSVLPVHLRSCPADRVLPALREVVADDPDYPWERIILETPPPRPVVQQVVKRDGIPGLTDDDLVHVAWALMVSECADDDLVSRVCREAVDRSLSHQVRQRYVRSLLRRRPPVTPPEAEEASYVWFDSVSGRAADRWPPSSGDYGADEWRPWSRGW